MGLFKVSPEDVLKSKVVPPGSYLLLITEIEEKANPKTGSALTIIHFIGLEGDAKDVPLQLRLDEQYPWAAIPFIKAMGGRIDEKKGAELELSNKTLKGKKVVGLLVNTESNGKVYNNLNDFRPAPGGGQPIA